MPMGLEGHGAKSPPGDSPATLGDVLYAGRSARPESEQGWVLLVQRIAAGDQLALHALYQRASRIVFALTMRITNNRETAEEVTLDVFHDIWRRAAGYQAANGTVVGWIMNQARSRAIDRVRFELRKKRVDPAGNELPPAVQRDESYDVLELKQDAQAVRQALAILTPDEREAIEAAFFLDLTHAEVAARLGQPLGTIKTRIRSGLHKLRGQLTVESDEHGPRPG